MSSAYYAQKQFNVNNLESNLSQFQNNYDLINNQSYTNSLARACPLTIQQRSNFQTSLLTNGHSLDALNTVGLSTATKDANLFKKPIAMHTINQTNQIESTSNPMSFTRHLINCQTGSTGQLNINNESSSKLLNGLAATNNLTNGFNYNSDIDVRRLRLSEQQHLEFNLVQELEQKTRLSEQNQLNSTSEIVHSTPKSYGTLKKNKQTKENQASTLTRQSSSESKVRNICAKLFGSNSSSGSSSKSNNAQTNLNKQTTNQIQSNCQLSSDQLNIKQLNGVQLAANNGQQQNRSSKLLASAVTNLSQQQQNKLNQKLDIQQQFRPFNQIELSESKEEPNVIYAEIRKKQASTTNCEKINQISLSSLSSNCMNTNCNLIAKQHESSIASNTSTIDDKYVVVVDSSSVTNNSDQNTSNQSLTVKNSPIKTNTSSTGILTTDLDQQTNQCNQKNTNTNNSQEHLLENSNEHLTSKQDKSDKKIGLESPTTSSSESGRGTLNGEQQNGHHLNLRQTETNLQYDQTSVTSEDMKRLKTFKEEVLENWSSNKKLIASNCIIVKSNSRSNQDVNHGLNLLDSSSNSKVDDGERKNDKAELNTFEQVQLKIQKLLNDDDAFVNDDDFDDLIASDAYQNYTAQAMNCVNSGKLDRLSVVNESEGSWLSDSTNANSSKNKLNSKTKSNVSVNNVNKQQQQLNQSNQQLNLNNSQQSNQSLQNKQQPNVNLQEQNKTDQQSSCLNNNLNSLKRNDSNSSTKQQTQPQQQLPQSSTQTKLEPPQISQQQSPHLSRLSHLHVHQSPKTLKASSKNLSKLNAKSITKLNGQQQTKEDFATLITENSRRLNKLNKNQFKNRSMDDLTDLMDDLNSVVTEATMNYAAPTVVKKQLRGIESMYSEVSLIESFF